MADEQPLALHTLKPAEGSTRDRKRIGRGKGSGTGKTAGRGQKGQKSRSGSHNMRPGFEGGQMPLYMRLGKLRGPNHKKSMPMGPFRTHTTPVNIGSLERFDAGVEVTPELLKTAGVVRSLKHPIKVLGTGELTKKLTVHAHGFSARARELIEQAGGTVVVLGGEEEPAPAKPAKARKVKAAPAAEPAAEEAVAEETAAQEPVAEEPEAAEREAAEEAAAGDEPAAEADETED
jgi:large subunit ribosomal protein L15